MARRKKGAPIHGWVVLDKPLDVTSTKAVAIVKRIFNAQKAGHAGTLDPLATGVLPIALGEATKTVSNVMDGGKIYSFRVKWGAETTTDDLEGEIRETSLKRPTPAEIEALLEDFTGTILQSPPAFSAVKIAGQRAYDLARAGETVETKLREVTINQLKIIHCPSEDETDFETHCGKGTYIRALARDLGRELGCLGHVSALRRLRSGPFCQEMSISLEKLEELSHSALAEEALQNALLPIETALDDIPALAINEDQAARVKMGQSVLITGRDAPIINGPAYTKSGSKLIALGAVQKGAFKPKRVFNLAV